MEQTTRKHSERAPAEQVEETPETDVDRETRLAELDELLDEVDEVLEDNETAAEHQRVELSRISDLVTADDPDAECARVGLFGPSDLEDDIAANLVAYAAELARQETETIQAELDRYVSEQNPPCEICGVCPVRSGCPFQADGATFYRSMLDGTFYPHP